MITWLITQSFYIKRGPCSLWGCSFVCTVYCMYQSTLLRNDILAESSFFSSILQVSLPCVQRFFLPPGWRHHVDLHFIVYLLWLYQAFPFAFKIIRTSELKYDCYPVLNRVSDMKSNTSPHVKNSIPWCIRCRPLVPFLIPNCYWRENAGGNNNRMVRASVTSQLFLVPELTEFQWIEH